MKRDSYMSKNELTDFMKIGVLAGEAAAIAERTPVAEWRRKLKCVSTYCEKIITERLMSLDRRQLESVKRRKDHTEIMLLTSDQNRVERHSGEKEITISTEDLYDLLDLAMLSCMKCPQGDCVKECHFRDVFHRLGVPPSRTNPADGECEFRYNNEILCVTPQYKEIKEQC